MQAQAWLFTLKHYFIVVGINYIATNTTDTEAGCWFAVVLIRGNAARWMDRLVIQGNAPNSFLEFDKLFINFYASLDDKNIAGVKLHELQQCGSL